MIIQILSNLFEEGYLERDKYSVLSAFFAGANVAFRRKALNDTGLYDTNCRSGEDQDMTLRVAGAGWELYFEPKAIIRHKNKMTTRGFVRKWFNYGYHHPYIFRKHSSRGFHVYHVGATNSQRESGSPLYRRLIGIRLPLTINIFITTFLFIHIFLVVAIVLAVLGLFIPAAIVGALLLALSAAYFKVDFGRRKLSQSLAFMYYRYIANAALLLGGFLGGIKAGMLYISPTFDFSK